VSIDATIARATHHKVSAATTNATQVSTVASQLYGLQVTNTNAAARKVAFHDTASAPTAGAGVAWSVMVPAGGQVTLNVPGGIGFAAGIAYTMTTLAADSDNTAVAAGDLVLNLFYE
jgi:hypothetical protein